MVYQHQKYGALPIANSEIIYLPQLTVEEIEREEGVSFHIQAKAGVALDALTPEEIDIIYKVANKFKNSRTNDIVEYMHAEDAYQETLMQQIIPFSLCATLKEF